MTRNIIFVFMLPFLISCGSDFETIEVKEEGKVVETYTRRKSDFAKHGVYTSYSPDGEKYEVSNYENNKLHGVQTFFYPNGQPQEVLNYNMGVHHGEYKSYFEDGTLSQEGQYKNGAMEGELKVYYPSGKIKEMVQLKNNEEQGPFKEFHENGNLQTEGTYNGSDPDTGFPLEHGELKKYDEQGELLQIMNCDNGRCHTTWLRDSTIVN